MPTKDSEAIAAACIIHHEYKIYIASKEALTQYTTARKHAS